MGEAGYPGARLSLVLWSNLLRFLADAPASVHELTTQSLVPPERIKFQLGCLERWGFVTLQPDPGDEKPVPHRMHRLKGRVLRDGWGSGRGIRNDWMMKLTSKGLKAAEIWPPLFAVIETRWEVRFGKSEIDRLRNALRAVVEQFDMDLPHGLLSERELQEDESYPPRTTRDTGSFSLATLLSQCLLAFAIEFDRDSRAPLSLCANVLRVLGDKPIRLAEIPQLTGGSPEHCAIGWMLKPYVVVGPDETAKRGKVARLSPRGLTAQQNYRPLVDAIEKQWEARFGKGAVRGLRKSLAELLNRREGDSLLLSQGLVPPPGTARAGDQAPALGRRDVGPAARQRMRDLVAQTEAFVRDPLGTLPHYPMWDMNRGFGP